MHLSQADEPPLISVVVCTDGRCESLVNLHACLQEQTCSLFEVIYIVGPTDDGSWEAASSWAATSGAKAKRCPRLNLSIARNLGIELAAGELIAFIDDDALPEPEWLENLASGFSSSDTGGVGGAVLDPTGIDYQFRYSAADRVGRSFHGFAEPPEEGAYPYSALFPHVMGANCMFRRSAVIEIGGFDEEFEYYLDETDLCCRLVDAGFQIVQLENAVVHHKFLRNPLRNEAKILLRRYPLLKNKIYFALRNALGDTSIDITMTHLRDFFDEHRRDINRLHAEGRIGSTVVQEFEVDAERAWRDGLERGLTGTRRLANPDRFLSPPPFVAFEVSQAPLTRSLKVFIALANVAEASVMAQARTAASGGHHVHVILANAALDDVSFADGIWVRRRSNRYAPPTAESRRFVIPDPLWRIMAAVVDEVERMKRLRPVDEIVDLTGLGLAAGLIWRGHCSGITVSDRDSEALLSTFLTADQCLWVSQTKLIDHLHAEVEVALSQAARRTEG